jgi:hypothetical protein
VGPAFLSRSPVALSLFYTVGSGVDGKFTKLRPIGTTLTVYFVLVVPGKGKRNFLREA